MGFFEGLGKVAGEMAKGAVEDMQRKQRNIQRKKEYYDRYDDGELLRKYKNLTGDDKLACAMVLRERGYGKQD